MRSISRSKSCKFILIVFANVLFFANGQDSETTENLDYVSSSDTEFEDEENLNSTNIVLKFPTDCLTPNFEPVYCVEISQCPVLNNVKHKLKYSRFVNASRCGPKNESKTNFKVCCGRYNNFRNFSIVEEKAHQNPLHDITVSLPEKCGTQRQIMRGRIVGGTEAILGEFPWMARILHRNINGFESYGCAGFLIHPKYVVTAAHCIISEFAKIRGPPYAVVLGEHNTETKIDCTKGGGTCAPPVQRGRISYVAVHEKYKNDSKNHHDDIALIQINKKMKITDFVQPICLLTDDSPDVKKYFISGWGKTETADYSPIKLRVDIEPFDIDACREKFDLLELTISDNQICAGGGKLKDSCNGDSGGPLMYNNGSHYFAAGLVSYGIGCGLQGWPGIYTRVPPYVEWIKSQMFSVSMKSPKIRKLRKKNKKKATTESSTISI